MNKFITLFSLAVFLALASAQITNVDDLKKASECSKYANPNNVCKDVTDLNCLKAFNEVTTCMATSKCQLKSSLGDMSSCISDCNTTTNEAVKKNYEDYADCLNGKILAFTALFSILFMFF